MRLNPIIVAGISIEPLAEADAAALSRSFEGAFRIGRVLPRGEKAILLT